MRAVRDGRVRREGVRGLWPQALEITPVRFHLQTAVSPAVQFSSIPQLCPTLCDPMDYSMPGLPVRCQLLEFTKTHVHWVGDAIHLILYRPLLPSVFPSIRVFSNESALCRTPKDWSFSFRISPSNEQSGLISFRMDWLSLLQPLTREGSGGIRARVLLGFHHEHPQRDRLGSGGPPERRRGLCLRSFGTGRVQSC